MNTPCTRCGANRVEGATFCALCGAAFGSNPGAASAKQAPTGTGPRPTSTRTSVIAASLVVAALALLATGYGVWTSREISATPVTTLEAGQPETTASLIALADEAEALAKNQADLTRQMQDILARYQARSGGKLPEGIGAELTPEQRALLTERLKTERMGTASLLQDLLTKDRQLQELKSRIAEVNSRLPDSVVASEGQRHERIAMDYLATQGLSHEQAYGLVGHTALIEPLVEGFRVFLLYEGGRFATWVTQGSASVSPQAVRDQVATLVAQERDEALKALEAAHLDRDDLRSLATTADRSRQDTQADLNAMAAAAERERSSNSTLRYLVGSKSELIKSKVIDGSYRLRPARAAGTPLVAADSTTLPPIDPSAHGIRKIKRVTLLPGLVAEGEDYTLLNVDGFLSVAIVRPDRFSQYAKYFVIVLE